MRLNILDIPEEGMELEASATDAWFGEVVGEAFQESYPKGSGARLSLHLLRTGENIQISGKATIDLRPICCCCLEVFELSQEVGLQVNMASEKIVSAREDDEVELVAEDMEFSFYKGDEIDLASILREMLLLEVPIRYVCTESCKGLCSQCGQNLNLATCTCVTVRTDPRFAVLGKLLKT